MSVPVGDAARPRARCVLRGSAAEATAAPERSGAGRHGRQAAAHQSGAAALRGAGGLAADRAQGRCRLDFAFAWRFACALLLVAAQPTMAAEAAEPQVLPPGVLAALATSGLPTRSFGVYVREVEGRGRPLAALNAEQPYLLASTTKVVTALAALDLLGPDYRWRTRAYTTGPIVDGKLLGDLVIVGGGDARLSTADLRAWFAEMRARGLDAVWGDIVLDRLAFRLGEADHANTPLPAPERPHHVRPDALTLDEGVLTVGVAAAPGARAALTLTPPLAGLPVVNKVSMAGGCNAWARMAEQAGVPRLVVAGSWSAGCGERSIALVPMSHGDFTVHALGALWAEVGGKLRGRVIDRPRQPRDARLAAWSVHASPALPEVIREINKTSNNMGARNLMLSLSSGFPGEAATLEGAQQRVHGWLLRQGLRPGDIEIDNGSGLARTERGKPRALVQLLAGAWHGRSAQAFVDSLPIAGIDGTLAHRMQTGAATGRAYLKTGTLFDTRALAGYVRAKSGKVYAVVAIVNHPEAARATPALDALIEWIARHG